MLSWRLGTIGTVELRVHATFVVLVLWALATGEASHESPDAGLALALAAALAVVVHELGQVLAARAFGIRAREVTLALMGGSARLEPPPATRVQEVTVALAGPLANLALAGACVARLGIAGAGRGLSDAGVGLTLFFERGLWANVFFAAMNLLPGFPLDGGRLLRAALTLSRDFAAATQLTARVGRALAIALVIAGLAWNPLLLVVAFVVWRRGPAEVALVEARRTSGEVAPVRVTVVSNAPDRADPLG